MVQKLIVAMSGASGAYGAELLMDKSPWPVWLIASRWAKEIYEHERGAFNKLAARAAQVFDDKDMAASPASGSVPTVGMVVLPCSAHSLGAIASGLGDNLITRAAHCHLKERRPLILAVRETPWTTIDLRNASRVSSNGGVIMPLSPPFYMFKGRSPHEISLHALMEAYVDRILALLGCPASSSWEDVR